MDAKVLCPTLRPKSPLLHEPNPLFKTRAPPRTLALRPRSLNAGSGPTPAGDDTVGSGGEDGGGSNSSSANDHDGGRSAAAKTTAQPRQPPGALSIRYRSISRKQARQRQQEGTGTGAPPPSPPAPPKTWEEMTPGEKAVDLYVGEKGLLFWLNKLAYASIFVVIGGWILFRFVGPYLGLYQLDTPPLSPSAMFKG